MTAAVVAVAAAAVAVAKRKSGQCFLR